MKRCLPTNKYIINKISDSKTAWERNAPPGEERRLDILFVMTNAKKDWVKQFKKSLEDSNAGWIKLVLSKDFKLDFEETGANMAIDMEVARMAAVYIGNGVSSFC
jgi:hypothetical protein